MIELKQTIESVEQYIVEHFEIGDDPDYSRDINLFDYGFIDSVGATELLVYLENHFNIEISQKDIILYPMTTVDEIATVVYDKLTKV